MKLKKALDLVLEYEGGYKLHKNPTEDYYTFAGIYQKYYPDWEGWNDIKLGLISNAIKKVEDFYRINFWNIIKGDYLPEKLAIVLFDTSVNIGTRKAIKFLQKTIKKDFKKEITIDGIIGKQTLSIIEQLPEDKLIISFLKRRLIYYAMLPENPYNLYKKGWINRTCNLLEKILIGEL